MILELAPGQAAQVDFGKGPAILDPRTGELTGAWIFVMTLDWSRHQYAEFVTDQKIETWLGCHRRTLEWFGGVPTQRYDANSAWQVFSVIAFNLVRALQAPPSGVSPIENVERSDRFKPSRPYAIDLSIAPAC